MEGLVSMVVVALGSNQGDSKALVEEAMDLLADQSLGPFRRSSLWRTSPVDCPPGSPQFINAVVGMSLSDQQTPLQFLDFLLGMENEFGRRPKKIMNEPRPLDLDLILWGEQECRHERLVVPHPRAKHRRFVLEPLAEIAPDLTWPGGDQTVAELLQNLGDTEQLECIADS